MASNDDEGEQSFFPNEDISQELNHLLGEAEDPGEYPKNTEVATKTIALIPTPPWNSSQINILYPDSTTKTVNIGGRMVDWEAILEFLKSLGLELVPSTNNPTT